MAYISTFKGLILKILLLNYTFREVLRYYQRHLSNLKSMSYARDQIKLISDLNLKTIMIRER